MTVTIVHPVLTDGAALGFAAASDAHLAVRVRDVRFGATPQLGA